MLPVSALQTYDDFILAFKQRSSLDLKAYKQNQMERRIRSFMHTRNFSSFKDFFGALQTDQALYASFFQHLTINVSQFFRDTGRWQTLREQVIPQHLRGKKQLKLWSAGCSEGQEPYSLAIMLQEHFPEIRFTILATDIDEQVLQRAQAGVFKQNDFVSTPPEILSKYFTSVPNGFKITDNIKKSIRFQKQNLLTDNFEAGFDLIACRNVVIYFTEETKEVLYRKFYHALGSGGVLFTGSTEHIFNTANLGLKSISSFFYQKIQ